MGEKMVVNEILCLDCVDGMQSQVSDETVDLVIADPPYFKVVNEKWDYSWRVEEDYISWSKIWLSEAYRVLRKGGSFYLFGYFRTLAYLIPVLEKIGFELRQQIVLNKGLRSISGRHTKPYKMFPNVTESILFLYKNPRPFTRQLLKERQKAVGLSAKEINEALGVKSNGGGMWSIYTGKNICEQLPTEEYWLKLQEVLEFEYPYEKLAITYNPQMGLTDVWDDIDFYMKDRIHPTQKPDKLIQRLVLASSNEGDLVLDPFMGSGTTAIAAIRDNRKYIGFEVDAEYHEASIRRVQEELNPLQLQILSV
jgi:DNA modification methylase